MNLGYGMLLYQGQVSMHELQYHSLLLVLFFVSLLASAAAARCRCIHYMDQKDVTMHQPGIEPGAQRWQRWILPLNH
jgi:hypothetical protein